MACALVPAIPLSKYSSRSGTACPVTSSSRKFLGSKFVRLNSASSGTKRSRRTAVSAPPVVCTSAKATSPSDPVTADVLQDKFGCQGVRFMEVAGFPFGEMKVKNRSSVRILIPGVHITSYKANMWHGGEEEMLHTVRTQSGSLTSISSSFRGGIELKFNQLKDPLTSILPSASSPWRVESVDCQPSEYAQMTMTNVSHPEGVVEQNARGLLQFKYVVTLCDDSLSAALVISNTGPVAVDFTGSILSHLAVGSAEGAFAVGLKGYRYRSLVKQKQKLFEPTNFFSQLWSKKESETTVEEMVRESSGRDARQELEGGTWIVESEDYSQLHGGMDRLYTSPPDSFSVMDRGRRRSLVFERHGFPEFCLSNPGPDSKMQDWNSFVCVGPTQSCQSVRLYDGREWRGAVTLLNRGAGDGELDLKFPYQSSTIVEPESSVGFPARSPNLSSKEVYGRRK
ncbi:hypothetical protein R1flu_000600 [Riccia fluitans]|uniref:NDH-dependent cyclic electron flow 5 n=1 Tax=Riccia fluitans TaxID=41844 RepID=A0ABD1Y0X7_9MARC